ncbi:hypothetical protein DL240_10260 [Lujinxingia litoralis]|uniref:Tetratricopeptide repeat protein n=1 Tax=Lujinxingia litoralis TaxID=2211119 RepID=A0A328CAF6_9DELT|nr:hypothetical protein [Lujinxingia litoralis]RAL22227.1 hypothetical protein DL240_10260 [Lujinxingia litoralis]
MVMRHKGTKRGVFGMLSAALVMLSASSAFAQQDDAYQEMLRLSARAQAHYDAGELAEAAETYREAYRAYPQPVLLKNEMISRYLLEDCARSMELASEFEASGEATADDLKDVSAVYADCSLVLAGRELEAGELDAARTHLEVGEPHWQEDSAAEGQALWARLAQARAEEEGEDVALAVGASPVGAVDGGGGAIGGWALTSVGVVGLVGASVWYLGSRSDFDELEEVAQAGRDRARYDELVASVERARWGVPTLYALSAVATAGGIAWVVLSSREEQEAPVVFSPVIGAQQAGAQVRVRF